MAPRPVAVSLVTSGWGLLYALYRGYYGLGGTAGMVGEPASQAQWRAINLAAAAVLLAAVVLPVAALPVWRRPVLVGVCWVAAVGCMNAPKHETRGRPTGPRGRPAGCLSRVFSLVVRAARPKARSARESQRRSSSCPLLGMTQT